MTYTATIIDIVSGERRTREFPMYAASEEGLEFMWSEGNFSCDCNRALFFVRAVGGTEDEARALANAVGCAGHRFRVPALMLADGRVIHIDGD